MTRFVCVHGHFYQPPRENPWTGRIDPQRSAAPYHDWNERITGECYAPNAEPVAVDRNGSVVLLPSNYSRMSFNFGPTLLTWLEEQKPAVYRSILAADRESRDRFSGHGSAIAQAYNHVILPLANARDRWTQVLWGIRDFEHRFRRSPEGMWLPETAVDVPTLETLARQGVRFTILSPTQALRWRAVGERGWRVAAEEPIDPRRPYEARLPSGNRIALFFYDGAASHAVAFGELAAGGENLARRLASRFSGDGREELVHIATDGETYGHHHRGGEKVLAEALSILEEAGVARLTNYGEYLGGHLPAHEVEIRENTAWSCAHELGRWSQDCGCRLGTQARWVQEWRAPLRAALDWLRDSLAGLFERRGSEVFAEPWRARDAYIEVLLQPSLDVFRELLRRHAPRPLDSAGRARARSLLEMQRHAMLMYTSCGWFFDDPSGLETTQILRYAARAIELAGELDTTEREGEFLARLELAPSNDPDAGNARRIYEAALSQSKT